MPAFAAAAAPPLPAELPHVVFVREYIRELGEFERLRLLAAQTMRDPDANLMLEMVSYSTQQQYALRTNIAALEEIELEAPYSLLLRNIINSHNTKLRVHGRIKEISVAMLLGPQAGDLGAMAAEMPALRAMLDDLDALWPDTSFLAFATLIDPVPDAAGQQTRLRITAAQRDDLLHRLQQEFGSTLDGQDANTLASAARVLRNYLQKDFEPSDG